MSYEPTVWENGDVITAEKLNHIENELSVIDGGGVVDFYSKHTIRLTTEQLEEGIRSWIESLNGRTLGNAMNTNDEHSVSEEIGSYGGVVEFFLHNISKRVYIPIVCSFTIVDSNSFKGIGICGGYSFLLLGRIETDTDAEYDSRKVVCGEIVILNGNSNETLNPITQVILTDFPPVTEEIVE